MKRRYLAFLVAGLTAALVTACGSHQVAAMTPPPVSAQMLDTAQVLSLARSLDETTEPGPVAGGLVVMTDTSETAEPISINVM